MKPGLRLTNISSRTVQTTVCLVFGVLFASAVMSQTRVGNWVYKADGAGTAFERRIAMTPAQPFSGGEPTALLYIRRMEPDSPIELVINATLDEEKKECDYDDWEIEIDSTEVPVMGFSIRGATAVLAAGWDITDYELWTLIKKGSKLAVRVRQKCDGFFGPSRSLIRTFSLRGSSAAYDYVVAKGD